MRASWSAAAAAPVAVQLAPQSVCCRERVSVSAVPLVLSCPSRFWFIFNGCSGVLGGQARSSAVSVWLCPPEGCVYLALLRALIDLHEPFSVGVACAWWVSFMLAAVAGCLLACVAWCQHQGGPEKAPRAGVGMGLA